MGWGHWKPWVQSSPAILGFCSFAVDASVTSMWCCCSLVLYLWICVWCHWGIFPQLGMVPLLAVILIKGLVTVGTLCLFHWGLSATSLAPRVRSDWMQGLAPWTSYHGWTNVMAMSHGKHDNDMLRNQKSLQDSALRILLCQGFQGHWECYLEGLHHQLCFVRTGFIFGCCYATIGAQSEWHCEDWHL